MRVIVTKITDDITEGEKNAIVDGFNQCFPKHSKSITELFGKYHSNHYGYSFHALCYEDDNLIGFISAIPFKYKYHDENITVALTSDIFIKEEARGDFTLFAQLYKRLKESCLPENIVCFLGVANENAYTYSVRILRCKEVMTLPYWILPVRAGGILKKKCGVLLNVFSVSFSFLALWCNQLVSMIFNSRANTPACSIVVDDLFLHYRLADSRYQNIIDGRYGFTYRITNDEGVKCAYILFLSQNGTRTYRALCKCVSYILHHESVDMIMFNGTLNLKQGLLLKTPKRFEPRALHLTVNFLTKGFETQYSDIMQPNGIDFTLLNLDVR